jgi:hypothetical protein
VDFFHASNLGYHIHPMHLWFLIVSLFLPRIAYVLLWFGGGHWPFPHPWDFLCWVFLPRIMVLFQIYRWQGFGLWFFIHLIAALLTYGAGGKKVSGR